MQNIGYLVDKNGAYVLVLFRHHSTYRSLRIRKGGAMGTFFNEESEFLKNRIDLMEDLKAGKVIKL